MVAQTKETRVLGTYWIWGGGDGVKQQGKRGGDSVKSERTDPFSPPISSVCWVFGPLPPGWSTTEHTLCSSIYHREIGESARVVELAVQVTAWKLQDHCKPKGYGALWPGHISLTFLYVCNARMCWNANGLSYPLNSYARLVAILVHLTGHMSPSRATANKYYLE